MLLNTIKKVIKSNDAMRNAAMKVYYEKRKYEIQNNYVNCRMKLNTKTK